MAETDAVKLWHSVINETRVKIISKLLLKPHNISGLEQLIKVDRSTLCYHLNILEDAGILKSEYQILQAPHSKGRAARVYSVDRKALTAALKAIDNLQEKIKV